MIASAIRDVTERKKLEEKLREKERLADMGTTATVFAHEVANPLNGLYSAAQLIKEIVPMEHHNLFDTLDAEFERLRSLLDQFRFLSRLEHLRVVSVEFSKVVDRVVKMHSPSWLELGICTVVRLSGDLNLHADEEKLQQIILNLCKNSVESMSNGGTLTLRGYSRGKDVIFELSDTGFGIPEGIDVFKLFATTKPQGCGLGLYIVQQIVSAHLGTISYSTEQGKGTTFRVTLPKKRNPKV